MTYLRNTWYVAAWDSEVARDALFSRTLLNESVLFFREDDGQVRAISNRCPHRFAPLHMGKRVPGGVECAYHGLRFDGAGSCIHNPHGNGAIPRNATLKSYPVVEKHGVIWIWMGEPGLASAALIPDFSCMDSELWWVGREYLHAKANYQLETDNIMDLSHVQFLHPSTLGGGQVKDGVIKVEQNGNTIFSRRTIFREYVTEYMYKSRRIEPGTPVDRWIDVRWDPPSNMLLYVGVVPTGMPRTADKETPIPHLFTPETETTTHYWFAYCVPKSTGDAGRDEAEVRIKALVTPFTTEDLPMLEGQQRMMGESEFWALKPILLPSDAAAVRARRVLDKLVLDEINAARSKVD